MKSYIINDIEIQTESRDIIVMVISLKKLFF